MFYNKKGRRMKKLTKFHVMMLMGLAVGSFHLQGVNEEEFANEAITLEQQVAQDEQAKEEVVANLTDIAPEMLDEIALDEAELNAHFSAIKNLVHKKNKEIEKLSSKAEVDEALIAKIGIELADAQIALKKAEAAHRAKHKKAHKFEQAINDSLKKAEQALKKLNDSAAVKSMKSAAVESGRFISENTQKAYHRVNDSRAMKATKKGVSQGAAFISEKAQQGYNFGAKQTEKAMNSKIRVSIASQDKKTKNPKKKSKASKAVIKASGQQPMLMDEDVMINQSMDDAMMNNEVVV